MTRWQAVKQFFNDWAYVGSGAAQIEMVGMLLSMNMQRHMEESARIYRSHGMHAEAEKLESQLLELRHPNGEPRPNPTTLKENP